MSEMDELSAAFSAAYSDPLASTSANPRLSAYKNRYDRAEAKQEARRQEYLEQQKQRRIDAQMKCRSIAFEEPMDDGDDGENGGGGGGGGDDEGEEKLDSTASNSGGRRYIKPKNYYKDQLMLSEWMVDIPPDLEELYCFIPVPTGKRCLVVAGRRITSVYTRAGYMLKQFESDLPGGFPKSHYTILDAIYSEVDRTFFILDIMCWAGSAFYDNPSELRFFWLQSKMAENPQLYDEKLLGPGKYMFKPLRFYGCSKQAMEDAMKSEWTPKAPMDGILFYHTQLEYTAGSTPLIGWLKPFMLPEILSVNVPQHFLQGHTEENAKSFISEFHESHPQWKKPTKIIGGGEGEDISEAVEEEEN